MKRKLFFFLEKLEIKRNERIAVSWLLIVLVLTSSIGLLRQPRANYDEEQYRKLEEVFKQKSEESRQQRELILTRYEPDRQVRIEHSIPVVSKQDTIKPDSTDQSGPQKTSDLININKATAEELQQLPGIGPAYARRILDWIEENGPFTSKEQLLEIKGIGDVRLAKIKSLITL